MLFYFMLKQLMKKIKNFLDLYGNSLARSMSTIGIIELRGVEWSHGLEPDKSEFDP